MGLISINKTRVPRLQSLESACAGHPYRRFVLYLLDGREGLSEVRFSNPWECLR